MSWAWIPSSCASKNIVRGGDAIHTGQVMLEEQGVGLEECLLKAKDALKWNERKAIRDMVQRNEGKV